VGNNLFCVEWDMKLEYGPMSNVMAAQPNIGGALCILNSH